MTLDVLSRSLETRKCRSHYYTILDYCLPERDNNIYHWYIYLQRSSPLDDL